MAVERTDGRARNSGGEGLGALLRDLAEGSASLVRGEILLARTEVSELLGGVARGTAMVAVGGVLALLGTLSLFSGLILLVGDQWLPRDRYWLAALIVVVITGGLAAWLAKRGMSLLSPSQLAPVETVTTLKEDKEWLKRQLT
jgi:drug/metabolite transporter (DMT)-like permease